MNTKHTPGPWKKIGYQSVQDARGMEISWCTVSAQFGKEPAEILTPEAEANARLIAAAPELLDICESILAEVDYEGLQLESGRVAKLRAAIAKANGETI